MNFPEAGGERRPSHFVAASGLACELAEPTSGPLVATTRRVGGNPPTVFVGWVANHQSRYRICRPASRVQITTTTRRVDGKPPILLPAHEVGLHPPYTKCRPNSTRLH